jgi:capsular polysaccharide transport system permease protein
MSLADYNRTAARFNLIDNVFVFRALILRELKVRYRDSRAGFLVEFVRPTAVIVAHYYFFIALQKPMPANIPVGLYVIAGFSLWYGFSHAVSGVLRGSGGAVMIPGVTAMHLRIARSAWELLFYLSYALAAVITLHVFGAVTSSPNVPLTFLVFGLAGALAFGYALLVDGVRSFMPIIASVTKVFTWALFITSGIYFSISQTPLVLAEVFWFNPLLHLVEYQRHAVDPGYPIGLVTLLYPAVWATGLLLAGLMLNRCCRHLAPS